MSAANFRRVNVAISVLLERAIILSKDKTGEDDSFIPTCPGFQTTDVLLGIRRVANYEKPVSRSTF